MNTYKIFGLNVVCDFELPKFTKNLYDFNIADVTIMSGNLTPNIPDLVKLGQFSKVSSKDYLLDIPDCVKFHVSAGKIVTVEKNHSITNLMLQAYLFSTAFINILQHRDYLVLHGSAVKIGDKAIIFSGPSGAGKSTLAATFMQRGYTMLTDDIVVISQSDNGRLFLVPGPPTFKLWQNTMDKLNISAVNATEIEYRTGKYEMPVHHMDPNIDKIEVCAFYELNSHNNNQIDIKTLAGIDKLELLSNNTFCYPMLKPMGKLHRHLKLCVDLGKHINVFKVHRPIDGFMLDKLVNRIKNSILL